MKNEISNLIGGLVLVFIGIISIVLKNRYRKIPQEKRKDYYTQEQVRNSRTIIGLILISIGGLVIIYYLVKIFNLG